MPSSLPYTWYLPDVIAVTVLLAVHFFAATWLASKSAGRRRLMLRIGTAVSAGVLIFGYSQWFDWVYEFVPRGMESWIRGVIIAWGFLTVPIFVILTIAIFIPHVSQEQRRGRRAFLRTAQAALFGAPAAALGYGVFIQRFQLRLREQDIVIPGLPEDLNGLKLVQLTDIHLSPFLSATDLRRAVDMANETRAHIALVTGDLITELHDPLDDCIRELSRLRAEAGVFGCMGNHERYAEAEDYTALESARCGIQFLRNNTAPLRFGQANLNIAGVDYQRSGTKYLKDAEWLIAPGSFNVLLSHNPDVFRVAARKGFDLTISGHTHGGQINVEILHQNLNVARFSTPYVDGLYHLDVHQDSAPGRRASIFVSRGIGTIGLPARIGAPPEVALLRLWRA